MARKEARVRIEVEGRDKGKMFLLREMPASQAERWAIRAFLAMAKSGIDIPDDVAQSGMAGFAKVGIGMMVRIPFEDADPLLAEMFQCISIIPDANRSDFSRGLVEDDIEEIATRLKLRMDVLKLHVDFSKAAAQSISGQSSAASPVGSSTT